DHERGELVADRAGDVGCMVAVVAVVDLADHPVAGVNAGDHRAAAGDVVGAATEIPRERNRDGLGFDTVDSHGYFAFMPGFAPSSTLSRNGPADSSLAARIIPSETPNFILRGARFATITVSRPLSRSGS